MKKKIVLTSCLSLMVAFFAMSFKNNSVNSLVKSNVDALVQIIWDGDDRYPEGQIVVLDLYNYGWFGPADQVAHYDNMGGMLWCGENDQHNQYPFATCYAIVWPRNFK